MEDRLTNQLDMIGSRITVANLPTHKRVWQKQDPADFETDLAALSAGYAEATAIAAQLAGAPTGPADEKDAAETSLEKLAHQVARALAIHFKKTGNLTDRAKVNIRLGAIQKLRDQALVARATEIRDLATAAGTDPDAAKRGITAARITALTGAIGLFDRLKNQPRGNIINRSAIRRDLETRVASLLEDNRDLDDLAIQFDDTEAGRLFIAAWQQAATIVDAGHRPAVDPATPTDPPTSA